MTVGLVFKDPRVAFVEQIAPVAEERGFSHLLFTELSIPETERITGRDPFVLSSVALGATTRLQAGTAVAGTVFHTARHLALRAATLHEQSGGRFVLGCGVAHRAFADLVAVPYPDAPVAHARAYCDELRQVCGQLTFGAGFAVWLAALGPRMAAVGAVHADGLLLNWVSPAWTRQTLERAIDETGRRPTVAVLLRVDHRAALQRAAERYLTTFTNYAHHFTRQGLSTAAEVAAQTCAPADDPAALAERIAGYAEAGADIVCVYPADMDEAAVNAVVSSTDTASARM